MSLYMRWGAALGELVMYYFKGGRAWVGQVTAQEPAIPL